LGALVWHVVDAYLRAPATDWVEAFRASSAREQAISAEAVKSAVSVRPSTTDPSLPPARYAGTYTDEWYGDVVIGEKKGGGLEIRFAATPALAGSLEPWQGDTFVARWYDRELRADAFVTFALNADGSVGQVRLRAVSPETDFSFDFQDLLLRPK